MEDMNNWMTKEQKEKNDKAWFKKKIILSRYYDGIDKLICKSDMKGGIQK